MLSNTKNGYGLIAILLHWLMAFAIFFMFGLGLYMVELTYYDAWYKGSLDLHKSMGITVCLLWCLRVFWRCFNVTPVTSPPETTFHKFEQIAAKLMHLLLYIVMISLMIFGYLISTADGRSISVFGLFEVPAIPKLIDNQEDVAGEIHLVLAWILIVLVAMHALAAIKHQFLDKDDTLMKMLKPSVKS